MTDAHSVPRSILDAQNLCRLGRLDEAARLFRDFLRVHPRHFTALHWLGLIYFNTGQYARAEDVMARALALNPRFFDGLRIRGLSLMQLGKPEAAADCLAEARRLQPGNAELLINHGTALLECGRAQEALAAFDAALARDSANAIAWNNRGNAFVALERFNEAVQAYDRALELVPSLDTAQRNRFLVQLKLGDVTRIADFALREMFDDVAPSFESRMVDGLDYRAHLHVRALADRVLPPRNSGLRILDLGCGTGLVGAAFRDLAQPAGRLDGLDLAPRMLEVARGHGIYDGLILGDLETVLAQPGDRYDLMVSADTMIYLGDLKATFVGVANRLDAGGFYIFACEALEGSGWAFHTANRFAHSESYLRDEAGAAGLALVALDKNTLRFEKSAPVPGFAVALQKL